MRATLAPPSKHPFTHAFDKGALGGIEPSIRRIDHQEAPLLPDAATQGIDFLGIGRDRPRYTPERRFHVASPRLCGLGRIVVVRLDRHRLGEQYAFFCAV
ncbi:MAG: hypothetical protein U1E97_02640 [Alphaproteobacteria bacterium]